MSFLFTYFLLLAAHPRLAAPSILNAKDLKKAPLVTSLEKLKEHEGLMNELWICAEKAKTTLKAHCDERAADELTEANATLGVRAVTPIAVYNYGIRHAIPISQCRGMLRSIRKVQKKNLPYCILGHYIDEPEIGTKGPKIGATFYQLKSPLGYVIDMDF